MADLIDITIDAHGGLDRFNEFSFLTARLVQGGLLWGLKGQPTVLEHANVRVDLKREWVSHWSFAPLPDVAIHPGAARGRCRGDRAVDRKRRDLATAASDLPPVHRHPQHSADLLPR